MDFLHRVQIREHELRVDDLDVVQRIDLARDVHDVVVLETAHEMRDRVRLANVREELIAKPLTLRRAFDEARDVDELDDGRHDLLGFHDVGERVELRIGHRDDADIRIDRAERIVLGWNLRRRERVEQRRLADVRQSDDAALDAHVYSFSGLRVCRRFLARSAPCSSMTGTSSAAPASFSRSAVSSLPAARFSTWSMTSLRPPACSLSRG